MSSVPGRSDSGEVIADADGGNAFEIDEIIDELREGQNEAVNKLLDIIEYQQSELRRLRASDRRADHRLDRIESNLGINQYEDPGRFNTKFDWRDQEVLNAISEENPDVVHLSRFKTLYAKLAKVRRDDTQAERIRFLTKEGPFEHESGNRWRYIGGSQ